MYLCKYIEQRYHRKDNNLPKHFLRSFKSGCFTRSLLHFNHVLTLEELSPKTDLVLITEADIMLIVIRSSSKHHLLFIAYVYYVLMLKCM